ncbi:MAG: hypothetical protein KAX33_10980 [Candidatus Lokiarchaeota archaeon]|nr:hypothetical protein [Candidatus Lokiarchaeota archaeon]
MFLEKLSDWPSTKKNRVLLIFSIILLFIVYPIMTYFSIISNYPVNYLESQLSFSGEIIKSHFNTMNTVDINNYRIAEILDYGFMVSYGILIFSLALIIARKFDESTRWRKSGFLIAILGIIAASLDAIENGFILAMLTDPLGFPDIWAVSHSLVSLMKWILLFFTIGWAISASLTCVIKKK